MICLYHSSDFDGWCSGAIAKLKHPDCELYGINHGEEIPWNKLEGQDVVLVDFSFQPWSDMEKLASISNLVWIDHHSSAIEEYKKKGFGKETEGTAVIGTKKSGCELAWGHFYTLIKMPRIVHLLGRYDIWDHSDPDVLKFQYGMREYEMDPVNEKAMRMWRVLLGSPDLFMVEKFIEDTISKGETILAYQRKYEEEHVQGSAFEMEFEGLRAIVVNGGRGSQTFDSMYDEKKHDLMIIFKFAKDKWVTSLYSTKNNVDCGKLCKARGGGGHKGAAGFTSKELPFDLPNS